MSRKDKSLVDYKGFYGVAFYNPRCGYNIGSIMRSVRRLGGQFMCIVGNRYKQQASDTGKAWKHIPMFHFQDFEDLFNNGLPYGCKLVGVEFGYETCQSLDNYKHPERALYLMGAEDHGLPKGIADRCHDLVYIESLGCLNVANTAAIVMNDRMTKIRQKGLSTELGD